MIALKKALPHPLSRAMGMHSGACGHHRALSHCHQAFPWEAGTFSSLAGLALGNKQTQRGVGFFIH